MKHKWSIGLMTGTVNDGFIDVAALKTDGHKIIERVIVPDNIYEIRSIVSKFIVNKKIDVIISSGGTGITGSDGTPEAIKVILDKEIEGFGELFRMISYQQIKTSSLQTLFA